MKNDLWKYVSGQKVKLEFRGWGGNALIEAWIIADRKARSDLILSIHPSELSQIRMRNVTCYMAKTRVNLCFKGARKITLF